MSDVTTSSPRRRNLVLALLVSLLFATGIARAQDAIRPSLAGEAAAEARRQTIDNIPYNLQAGPIKFRFSATMGVEYNDNINLAEDRSITVNTNFAGPITFGTKPESDVILHPQINLDALWPITQLNTLRLDLGIGHSFYLDHSEFDTNSILISPGSQLAFDVFVGDFRINIHDRFSLQQDPIAEFQISNTADYGRFENTAGISALWDLNQAVVTLGYDHYNFIATNSEFDYLNRNADMFTGSVGFTPNATMTIGVEGSYVNTYYEQNVLNDSQSYSAGAFLETQITSNLRVRVAGGYQKIDFDNTGQVNDSENSDDYYANLVLSHRVNAAFTHNLAIGHETTLGINSNYVRLNYIRHTANWNILYHTLLTTELFYEDAEDSSGGGFFITQNQLFRILPEHLHRYGGAISVGYQLTPHVTLGLRYQYTQKDSDVLLRDYRQNRVSLDGTYSF